jgi:hypothetical protein
MGEAVDNPAIPYLLHVGSADQNGKSFKLFGSVAVEMDGFNILYERVSAVDSYSADGITGHPAG